MSQRYKIKFDDKDGSTKDAMIEMSSGRVYEAGTDRLITTLRQGNRGLSDSQLAALSVWSGEYARRDRVAKAMAAGARNADANLLMDLAPTDVHVPAAVSNAAMGYKLADGAADIASPIWPVAKPEDKYWIWDSRDAFQMPDFSEAAPGAAVQEINPRLSTQPFTTVARAYGGFISTEVQSAADSPLKPAQAVVRRCMRAAALTREFRVQNLLRTTGNWNSALVQSLTTGAGTQWGGPTAGAGASSDPIANMHAAELASAMTITRWLFSTPVVQAFVENPKVRSYYFAKTNLPGIPSLDQLSNTFGIAPITEVKMKYYATSTSSLTYMWGGDAVGIHEPDQNPPQDQEDVATSYTARWNGGTTPDGTFNGGILVRSFFDERRGPRGGNMVIVVHQDAEIMTSNLVGGLITGAWQ